MNAEEREQELRETPFQPVDKSKWPDGVRTISLGEIDALGIDKDGQLYWHGHPVVTKRTVDLTGFQTLLAVIVAVFTVVGGVGSAAQGLASYADWACKVGWFSPICPTK